MHNRSFPAEFTLRGVHVTLRPLAETRAPALAHAIAADEGIIPWWGTDPEDVLRDITHESVTAFTIEFDNATIGVIMFEEQTDPGYRHANIDIAVLTPYSARGLGPDALRTLARYLFTERGHHRINIDPAASNARAIRAYEKIGFKPVGIMRRYERLESGEWRDALLMDLLAEELLG